MSIYIDILTAVCHVKGMLYILVAPFNSEPLQPTPSGKGREEPWEKEVDDLVTWTNNLDEAALET